ncbi:nitric oxide synthase oxygenase [Streptomyces sp. ME03-5709C]|nr:nitric oxide synthase oxygenase [Streptomyces sp. ME03-5709C]
MDGPEPPAGCPEGHPQATEEAVRARHSVDAAAPCPVGGAAGHDGPPAVRHKDADVRELATDFLRQYHHEQPGATGDSRQRLADVLAEIDATGTYRHTREELVFGARVAWRNSNRCIGRLYWNSLQVRDRRHVATAGGVAQEAAAHLRAATNGGRIRPVITVFAPDRPDRRGPRIWNDQLIRYAGYPQPGGGVLGDPATTGITEVARQLGWSGGPGTPFDVLPLVVQGGGAEPPRHFPLPADAVLEVPIVHPDHDWLAQWDLRWHAVPAVSSMCLEIGGVCYPAAPFNGWYMGTEIGARNLADTGRYDLLPRFADQLGLDTGSDRTLWRDRALVELNRAVLHSFDRAGVSITDHHTESRRFLAHIEREERKGRPVPADWSWIVPPISGSATGVFHRYYDTGEPTPAYVHHPESLALSRGETAV